MLAGKVLIVVENNAVPQDRRVWYEATALRDAGWRVSIICPADKGQAEGPEQIEGITVYRFPVVFAQHGVVGYLREYFQAFLGVAQLTWRVWHAERFDILQVCNPPDIFFPIGLWYQILGARFVFDHHDLFTESVAWRFHGLSGKLLYAAARLAELCTLRSADLVIATNQTYARLDRERAQLPQDRVVVVRNGPRGSDFIPVAADPTLRCGLKHLVGFVGIMGDEDGVHELLDSIHYLVHERGCCNIKFLLVGDGPARAQALKRVSDDDLTPYVEMPGAIWDDARLRTILSTADVLVSPEPKTPMNDRSTFIKVGEYMAVGRPIVAYDLTETRTTAGEAAWYVTPGDYRSFGDAIITLLNDPARATAMGLAGSARIREHLNWEYQSKQLLHVYTALFRSDYVQTPVLK